MPNPAAAGARETDHSVNREFAPLAFLQQLGPGRIIALGVVALALLSFFAFIVFRATEPRYTLLFGNLELDSSREIISQLDARDIPYRLSEDGRAILVPEDRALRLRMELVADGTPGSSGLGYEIFDRDGMFGTTDFVSNVNLKRALEGELARTISSLAAIRSARVHLVLPERQLFRSEPEDPSASVFVMTAGSTGLSTKQVSGIQHLVAAAVPGLDASNVAVLDGEGRLLARGDDESAVASLSAEEEHRIAVEERLQRKIVRLLERSLGPGKVEAQVTAEMSFEEVTTSAEIFDPESQVARSIQSVEEESDLNEQEPGGGVSVANALPGADDTGQTGHSKESRTRTEETVNYEISRTLRNESRRGGTVERLSVAVQVDGHYEDTGIGEIQFHPLSDAELAELEGLVRSAVGIDDSRGDRLEIASLPFHRPEPARSEAPPLLSLSKDDYWRFGELGLFAILTLLVLQLAVRPILRGVLPVQSARPASVVAHQSEQAAQVADNRAASGAVQQGDRHASASISSAGQQQLTGPAAEENGSSLIVPQEEEMVSLKQIAGKVRASLVQEVTEIIEERPDDATRVVRSWLHSD